MVEQLEELIRELEESFQCSCCGLPFNEVRRGIYIREFHVYLCDKCRKKLEKVARRMK